MSTRRTQTGRTTSLFDDACDGRPAPRPAAPPAPGTPPAAPGLLERVAALEARLDALTALVAQVHELVATKSAAKEFYTTAEVARIVGKRPYTVREWCRLGRVNAVKTHAGRGGDDEWRVSHDELTRYRNHGLLPGPKY